MTKTFVGGTALAIAGLAGVGSALDIPGDQYGLALVSAFAAGVGVSVMRKARKHGEPPDVLTECPYCHDSGPLSRRAMASHIITFHPDEFVHEMRRP